jgi:hypothetical protein
VTDTCGWLLAVAVTGANVKDRDAGRLLLWVIRTVFPTIRLVWADSGYTGKLVDYATTILGITCRSCPNSPDRSASSSGPAGVVWSAPSPGSTAADEPSETTNGYPNTTPPPSTGQ